MGSWFKELVPICDTEHLSTQLEHRLHGEQPGKEEISVLVAVLEKSSTIRDQVRAVRE